MEALKGCQERGMKVREALEKLHGVNDHSASAWKDYFLDNIDRLYPRIRPPRFPPVGQSSHIGDRPPTNTTRQPRGLVHRPRLPELPRTDSHRATEKVREHDASRTTKISTVPRPRARVASPAPVRARSADSDAARASDSNSTPTASSRRRRGEPVLDFHAGTYIPATDGRRKPFPPPIADPAERSRFTEMDKIFFIHYLRWRVTHDPTVTRDDLYTELAKQAPSHNAEAWKRHWDKHPELPDQILINARRARSAARPADAEGSADEPHDSSSEEESDRGDEDGDVPSRRQWGNPITGARGGRKPRGQRSQRVTEEDLQAMARYMLEKVDSWDMSTSRKARWSEFAERPENKAKRTIAGWSTIESTHETKLRAYFKQLLRAAQPATAEREQEQEQEPEAAPKPRSTKSPSKGHPSGAKVDAKLTPEEKPSHTQASSDSKVSVGGEPGGATTQNDRKSATLTLREALTTATTAATSAAGPSRKRGAEELEGHKEESPERKRPKEQTPLEIIELSD
ncbi:hypothetical protein C8Q77DRAFT_1089329 [Trametes polyzona]|nr:hypothetical protein C8Q77DRAFT_1089329 [Trametes polyzona]